MFHLPAGLVLLRLGCIDISSPNPLDTASHTLSSDVCKLIIVQLKLCHPCPPRACVANLHLLLQFFFLSSCTWLSVLQVLYLILECNARLVYNTENGTTRDTKEGIKRASDFPFGVHDTDDWSITTY